MAYCRFSMDSDVYFYASTRGGFDCVRCLLETGRLVHIAGYKEAVEHLNRHRQAGHKVPDSAFAALRRDFEAGEIR